MIYSGTKFEKPNGSLGIHIPKEIIQRKIDILLYTTAQQIKNLILKQTQEVHPFTTPNIESFWMDASFAQNLSKQVSVLSAYIEGQSPEKSRVLLNQLIDVSLESLLMLKRVLVDVTLKQNIFIIDSTKQILPFVQQELIERGKIVNNKLVIMNDQDIQSQKSNVDSNLGFITEM